MVNQPTDTKQTPGAEQAPAINEILFTYSDGVTDNSLALRCDTGRWLLSTLRGPYDSLGEDGTSQEFATRQEAVASFKNAIAEVVASL